VAVGRAMLVTLCDVHDSGDSSAAAAVRSDRLFVLWDYVMGLSRSEITTHALSANNTTQHNTLPIQIVTP